MKKVVTISRTYTVLILMNLVVLMSISDIVHANSNASTISMDKARVVEHWTRERKASAIPRDLVIDKKGLGYLRKPDGSLLPYGQHVSSLNKVQTNRGKPSTGSDTTGPVISIMSPAEGEVIADSHLFTASIVDTSGIKSVSFVITYPDGVSTQSFTPTPVGDDNWSVQLQGFSNGDWQWHVVAKDNAGKGGNTTTSSQVAFTVNTGSVDNGGSNDTNNYIVTNSPWLGGVIQRVSGRIYFEMPANSKRKGPWNGYVCSGTVMTDDVSGRSIIITAAHCVYDDSNKAFARNVLFIPNQVDTTGIATDLNCNNDPLGCWVPSFGVVDINWTTSVFPNNIAWDYAYYVVNDTGSHIGADADPILDVATGSLPVNFLTVNVDDGEPSASSSDFTHALGYSYSDDPNFMYCAEDMTTEGDVNWWLASCGLSGGASGGAWLQPMDESQGTGTIISVNSWGYTTAPGMAGPKLLGSTAECLFSYAASIDFIQVSGIDGDEGFKIDTCP